MTRVACYRVLDTEQYAMHHATGPQREHAGHQKREDVAQHHPDLVLTNTALTGVINRHDQREQGPDVEQVNRAESAPQLRLTDKNDEAATKVIRPTEAQPKVRCRAVPLADANCAPPKTTAAMAASSWLRMGMTQPSKSSTRKDLS